MEGKLITRFKDGWRAQIKTGVGRIKGIDETRWG